MILFLDDWLKYPRAIVHRNTKNKSFLQIAEKLKKMGVKNYFFMLALMQPELEFVDPHDPNLDEETKSRVALECKYNPWYAFRECLRVPPQGGSPVGLPLRANRGNMALFWTFFNHIIPYLIQPRQTGKSLGSDFLSAYLNFIACTNTRINLFTKDNPTRVSNVERIKEIRSYMPSYLQARYKSDSDNTIEVTCDLLNNVISTAVAQNNKIGANGVGRGLTAPINIVDEGPFCTFIKITLPAMLASGTAARDEARTYGTPYGTIFTTTAGKLDEESGEYMYELLQGGMPWSDFLYDCKNEDELREVVKRGSPGLMPLLNITLSHRQLGYTDEWLVEKLRENNSKGEDADRDFFLRWTSGSLSSPLLTSINEELRKSIRDPDYVEITKELYTLRWYIPQHEIATRMASGKFVAGMDTSEAVGRDSITLVIMDAETMETVAAADVNETNLIKYAEFIVRLLVNYKNITLIPERKSTCGAILDLLLLILPTYGVDPFKRIYNVIVDEPEEYPDEKRIVDMDLSRRPSNFYDRCKKYFGFATTGTGKFSRSMLYSEILQRAARISCFTAYDRRLVTEITGLTSKNGRIDHGEGKHDDMVISWLLCVWFLTRTRNLGIYGITNALTRIKEYDELAPVRKDKTEKEIYVDRMDEMLKLEIERLLNNMKNSKDENVIKRLEYQVRGLDMRLSTKYSVNATNLDGLIEEIKQQQSRAAREQYSQARSGNMRNYSNYY